MKSAARKCKKGFTLVELIVVIVIIAILAAIAIPAMTKYIENSHLARAEANCRAVVTAVLSAKILMDNYVISWQDYLKYINKNLTGDENNDKYGGGDWDIYNDYGLKKHNFFINDVLSRITWTDGNYSATWSAKTGKITAVKGPMPPGP